MLELKNINVSFRSERQDKIFGHTRQQVLFDVSLTVKEGTCLGILGESGSGKSTIIKLLTGEVEPVCCADCSNQTAVKPFWMAFRSTLPVPDDEICKTNSVSCFRITQPPQIPGSASGILLGKG